MGDPTGQLFPDPEHLEAMPRRAILHWTAGTRRPSLHDREHYHMLIGWDGAHPTFHRGVPMANNLRDRSSEDPTFGDDPSGYAAHTRGMNSYSLGIAVCGMAGAQEEPFDPGPEPITALQVKALVSVCATACVLYDLEPTADELFTHPEAERIHGVEQRGKWDLERLPSEEGWRELAPEETGPWLRHQVAGMLSGSAKSYLSEVPA